MGLAAKSASSQALGWYRLDGRVGAEMMSVAIGSVGEIIAVGGSRDAAGAFDLDDTWRYRVDSFGNSAWRRVRSGFGIPVDLAGALGAAGSTPIVVGQRPTQLLAETWVWTGNNWSLVRPAGDPWTTPREGHRIANDTTQNVAILFGGFGGGWPNDTWLFDGSRWTRVLPQTNPPPPLGRTGHVMAYDPVSQQTVMFGGRSSAGTALNDTWLFDTSTRLWTNVTPTNSPSARENAAMSYDPSYPGSQSILLFGGEDVTVLNDTWSFDAGARQWVARIPTATPAPRARHSMAWTTQGGVSRVVVLGGRGQASAVLGDQWSWAWDGSTGRWQQAPVPAIAYWSPLAFDLNRGVSVMFCPDGQQRETWELAGASWQRRASGAGPLPRIYHAMAYNEASGKTLLFGGQVAGLGLVGDTWEWDGASWTQVNSPTSPNPRQAASMVFDAARQQVVLFGGETFADTWTYSNRTWTQVLASGPPPARGFHQLAYDRRRQVVVLHGGQANLNDTWEWSGQTWVQRFPASAPPPRERAGVAYDAVRERVVLYGGNVGGNNLLSDVWDWDGTQWTQRPTTTGVHAPTVRAPNVAYDAVERSIVVFAGHQVGNPVADTWNLASRVVADSAGIGSGCSGTLGRPVLTVPSPPWVGTSLSVQQSPLYSGWLVVGFSALPALSLFGLGASDCYLHVSPDVILPFAGSLSLPIPNNESLAGAAIFLQVINYDPFSSLPLVASNALETRLGIR